MPYLASFGLSPVLSSLLPVWEGPVHTRNSFVLVIYSSIQQVFIQCLLCARTVPGAWNTSVNKTNLLASVSVLVGQTDNKTCT